MHNRAHKRVLNNIHRDLHSDWHDDNMHRHMYINMHITVQSSMPMFMCINANGVLPPKMARLFPTVCILLACAWAHVWLCIQTCGWKGACAMRMHRQSTAHEPVGSSAGPSPPISPPLPLGVSAQSLPHSQGPNSSGGACTGSIDSGTWIHQAIAHQADLVGFGSFAAGAVVPGHGPVE